MAKYKNGLFKQTALATFSAIALLGCMPNQKPSPRAEINENATPYIDSPVGSNIAGRANPSTSSGIQNLNARAQKLANAVAAIPEIDRASVIVVGRDTAVVGIRLQPRMKQEQSRAASSKVRQTVLDTDQRIKNVTVTSSPELVNRITNLSNKIKTGKNGGSLVDEVRGIIKNIAPTF